MGQTAYVVTTSIPCPPSAGRSTPVRTTMLQWSGASVRTDTSPRLRRTRCSRTSTTRWPSADSSTMGYQAPRRRMSATLSAQRAQPSLICMRSRLTSYHVLIDFVMRDLGRIVRLQIQRSSLKTGEKPLRVYDPTPCLAVARLAVGPDGVLGEGPEGSWRSEEHTSELQSPCNLVCRLLLEKKKRNNYTHAAAVRLVRKSADAVCDAQ